MCKDVTGQSGEFFSHGIGMALISVLDCKVLDHFIRTVAPSVVKRISPPANCRVGSKDPTVCGNRFEGLRKEKYATSNKVCTLKHHGRHHIVKPTRSKGQYVCMSLRMERPVNFD